MKFIATMNEFIVELFKFSTLLHASLLLITIIIQHLKPMNHLLYSIIDYAIMLTALISSICVATKGMQYFIMHHHRLMHHYKTFGIIIESIIINSMILVLFINEEITGQFILFINELSLSAHDNKIIAIVILIGIYLSIKFYHDLHINEIYLYKKSLMHLIAVQTIDLIAKIVLLSALTLGLLYPVSQALQKIQFLKFASLIRHLFTTALHLYKESIIVLIILSISIYYAYIYYKKIKRKSHVR